MRRSCGRARSRPRCRLVGRLSALREVASPARSAGRRSCGSARNPGSRPRRLARARPPRCRFRCYQRLARRARRLICQRAGAGRVGAGCRPAGASPPATASPRRAAWCVSQFATARTAAAPAPDPSQATPVQHVAAKTTRLARFVPEDSRGKRAALTQLAGPRSRGGFARRWLTLNANRIGR